MGIVAGAMIMLVTNAAYASDKTKQIKIVLLTGPSHRGFWPMSAAYAQAVADDLGIKLVIDAVWEPAFLLSEVRHQVSLPETQRPDAIIFQNHRGLSEDVLKMTAKTNTPTILYMSHPGSEDDIGLPREKYKQFIGLLTPADEKAGYDLANELFAAAMRKGLHDQDGKIHVVALDGPTISNVSRARKEGFLKAVAERDDVIVEQHFVSRWRRELGYSAFKAAKERYAKVDVVWAGSDSMALGVLDAAEELKVKPGEDFVLGSIDLLPNTLEHIRSGAIELAIGANYTDAVWAILLAYDYLQGCDFDDLAYTGLKSSMLTIRHGDDFVLPSQYHDQFKVWAKGTDFAQFSRCANASAKGYSFDPIDLVRDRH